MRIRLFLLTSAILTLVCIGAAQVQVGETSPADLLKTADEMVQVTSRIRGLEPKAPIARGVKTRAEITQFLNEQITGRYQQTEIEHQGKLLRVLGLIPESMNYKEFVIKLLSEQIGGFYDPEKKIFFIASWLSVTEQKPVMVHELAHALQDQHFDARKILDQDRHGANDDAAIAHEALLEGDGMCVMLNYILEPAKRDFSQLPDLVSIMRVTMETEQLKYDVFRSAPPFLQETLLFPYGYGAAFLQKIWAQNSSWKTIDKIYSDLPASTEQIIHPEKYYTTPRDNPKQVDAQKLAAKLGKDWKVIYKNVMGEFSLGILLSQQISEARAKRSSAGWGGDQVLLLENAAGRNAVLIDTVWDTPNEADEFYAAVQAWLEKKYPAAKKADETSNGFSVIDGKEAHAVRRDALNVRLAVGFSPEDVKKF